MKRFVIAACAFALIALVTAQNALAARIYNFLPVPVDVVGTSVGIPTSNRVHLGTGQRSDSLGWPNVTGVYVNAPGWSTPVCLVSFLTSAHIQGGNYMVIGHDGDTVVCDVCNSSHQRIAGNQRRVGALWDGKKYPSSQRGC